MTIEANDPRGVSSAPPAPVRPPGPLGRLYREEAAAWRTRYKRYFKYAARALGLGFVAGFLYFMLWPAQEKRALAFVVQALKDIPLDEGPALMALTLFYHNAQASVVAVAAGIVPFLFLPILDPLLNGGVLGLLVSIARHQRLDVPRLVLTQILPHGLFELTAVLYATGVGLYVSAALGRKVIAAWRKRNGKSTAATETAVPVPGRSLEGGPPIALETDGSSAGGTSAPVPGEVSGAKPPAMMSCEVGLFRDVVRSFALIVLPLLLIAAFIEAFITPHLR